MKIMAEIEFQAHSETPFLKGKVHCQYTQGFSVNHYIVPNNDTLKVLHYIKVVFLIIKLVFFVTFSFLEMLYSFNVVIYISCLTGPQGLHVNKYVKTYYSKMSFFFSKKSCLVKCTLTRQKSLLDTLSSSFTVMSSTNCSNF